MKNIIEFQVQWGNGSAVFSVIFLTLMSGWLAAVLLDYLYAEVGESYSKGNYCNGIIIINLQQPTHKTSIGKNELQFPQVMVGKLLANKQPTVSLQTANYCVPTNSQLQVDSQLTNADHFQEKC